MRVPENRFEGPGDDRRGLRHGRSLAASGRETRIGRVEEQDRDDAKAEGGRLGGKNAFAVVAAKTTESAPSLRFVIRQLQSCLEILEMTESLRNYAGLSELFRFLQLLCLTRLLPKATTGTVNSSSMPAEGRLGKGRKGLRPKREWLGAFMRSNCLRSAQLLDPGESYFSR